MGGEPVESQEIYPWITSLKMYGSHSCGGGFLDWIGEEERGLGLGLGLMAGLGREARYLTHTHPYLSALVSIVSSLTLHHTHPYSIYLSIYLSTGSMIAPNLVLTAGHCTDGSVSTKKVSCWRYDISKSEASEKSINFSVMKMIRHPNYTTTRYGTPVKIKKKNIILQNLLNSLPAL